MPLRIAYITYEDPTDVRSWSGIHKKMFSELQKRGFEVISLGPVHLRYKRFLQFVNFVLKKVFGKQIRPGHALSVSKLYGRVFAQKIQQVQPDLIIGVNASTELACLPVLQTPIIYLSGGTFKLLEGYYPGYKRLLKHVSIQGNKIELQAIQKATRLIYPTFWAANSAINHYGAEESKVRVIPYGANVLFKEAPKIENRLKNGSLRLLLVGVNWESKGVPIAIDTVKELKARGIDVRLDICGCKAPYKIKEENIFVHGFLNKNIPEESEKLKQLYLKADFFILPTRNENFGVSFVEACAAGLPCLGTRTGGVPTIIEHGKNGYLFELEDPGKAYADRIEYLMNNRSIYLELAKYARTRYEQTFNWKVWGEHVESVIEELFEKKN